MRASSKARGEANAISCVRSYSTMSFHHSSAVSFFYLSKNVPERSLRFMTARNWTRLATVAASRV